MFIILLLTLSYSKLGWWDVRGISRTYYRFLEIFWQLWMKKKLTLATSVLPLFWSIITKGQFNLEIDESTSITSPLFL